MKIKYLRSYSSWSKYSLRDFWDYYFWFFTTNTKHTHQKHPRSSCSLGSYLLFTKCLLRAGRGNYFRFYFSKSSMCPVVCVGLVGSESLALGQRIFLPPIGVVGQLFHQVPVVSYWLVGSSLLHKGQKCLLPPIVVVDQLLEVVSFKLGCVLLASKANHTILNPVVCGCLVRLVPGAAGPSLTVVGKLKNTAPLISWPSLLIGSVACFISWKVCLGSRPYLGGWQINPSFLQVKSHPSCRWPGPFTTIHKELLPGKHMHLTTIPSSGREVYASLMCACTC